MSRGEAPAVPGSERGDLALVSSPRQAPPEGQLCLGPGSGRWTLLRSVCLRVSSRSWLGLRAPLPPVQGLEWEGQPGRVPRRGDRLRFLPGSAGVGLPDGTERGWRLRKGQGAESRDGSETGTGRAPREEACMFPLEARGSRCLPHISALGSPGWVAGTPTVCSVLFGTRQGRTCLPLWDSRCDQEDAISQVKYLSCWRLIRENKEGKGFGRDEGCHFKRGCRDTLTEEVTG